MSQSTPTTENRNIPGQTVHVPKPGSGADIAVVSSPSGTLQLDFDPSTATTSRDGNSLVFEVDGGGKVTVTDFFVVGDQSLPSLALPDGTEVASADFFEGSDLDISTAAGPAAGSPPGGGTNYADDPGNLLNGVDKFGKLGTDYWGRNTEPTPEMEGPGRLAGIGVAWSGDDAWNTEPGGPGGGDGAWSGAGVNGGRFILYESALPNGTNPANGPVSATSVLHVTTNNSNFIGLTIGGRFYSLQELQNGVTIGRDLDGDSSPDVTVTFTYTGNNNVEVTVTLDNAIRHIGPNGENLQEVMDGLGITAHDSAGNSASAGMSVTVVDDNPIAMDDAQRVTLEHEDGSNYSEVQVKGNVLEGKGEQIKDGQSSGEFDTGVDGKSGADQSGADGYRENPVDWIVGGVSTENRDNNPKAEQDFKTQFTLQGNGPTYIVMDGDKVVGELTLNRDGSYEFKINPSYEPEHGDHTIIIPYTVTDSDGDSARANLSITIENVNDRPVFTVDENGFAASGDVKETGVYAAGERDGYVHDGTQGRDDENAATKDGGTGAGQHQLTASGDLHATDADSDKLTYGAGEPAAGSGQTVTQNGDGSFTINDTYGDLTIWPDGHWEFQLNDGAANHLGEGQSHQVQFPVIVQDNSGAANDTNTGSINITVHGTNDAPTLQLGDDLVAIEGVNTTANTSVSGQATATDPDDDDQGNLRFGLETPNGAVVNALFVVPDGQGGYTLETTAPKDGNYYGTFSIDSGTGKYTFTLNNSAQCVDSLNVGDNPNFGITVVVQDTHGAYDKGTVSVTIEGRNDSPKITGGTTGAVKEEGVWGTDGKERDGFVHDGTKGRDDENAATKDGGIGKGQHQNQFEGKLEAFDPDDDASTLTFRPTNTTAGTVTHNTDGSYTMQGTYGTLTIRPDGSYTYTLDEAKAQSLTEGQLVKENFPVTVQDPHGATGNGNITINVYGTNDAPEFTQGAGSYVLMEDGGTYSLSGQVAAIDPDAGETAQLRFGFEAPDGSVQTTLYAVPAGYDQDGKPIITFTTTMPADGEYYGRFTIDPVSGQYKFEMNNNAKCVQGLGEGEFADIHLTVVVQDPHGAYDKSDLNVRIDGADDLPTINMDLLNPSQTVIEAGVEPGGNKDYAGKPTVSGTIHATDPDIHDEIIYKVQDKDGNWHNLNEECKDGPLVFETGHGTVVITDNGNGSYHYEYTLNNNDPAVNGLNRQDTMGDGFPLRVENQNGQGVDANIKITIVGTNDRPIVESNEIFVDKQDARDGTFSGRVMVSDPDTGDHGNTASELAEGAYNLKVTGEGGKNFVALYDEHGREVGTAEIKPDGSYTINLNSLGKSLLLAMAEGEFLDVHTVIRVTDKEGAWSETDVTWKVEGTDDAPTLGSPSVSMREDGWLSGRPVILVDGKLVPNPAYDEDKGNDSINGQLKAGSVDKFADGADQFTYSMPGDADHDGVMWVMPDGKVTDTPPAPGADYIGVVELQPDGKWTFTLNNDSDTVNKLRPGEELNIKIPVHVEDDRGYSSNANINIKIDGTNDRPSIDQAPDLNLNQNPDNPHAADSYIISGQALASDPDNVVYRPDASGGNLGGATQNAGSSEITFCFIDPKTGQPVQSLQLEHGSVSIDPKTGVYTYTFNVFDNDNFDPATGKTFQPMSDSFTIYARDKSGAYSEPQDVNVKIGEIDQWTRGPGGPGEAPTLDAGDGFTVWEDNRDYSGHGDQSVVGEGKVSGDTGYCFLDASGNRVQSVPAMGEDGRVYGSFVINPITGEYKLILNNGSDFVQELNEGEMVNLKQPTVVSWNGGKTDMPPHQVGGTEDTPEFADKFPSHSLTEGKDQNGGDSVNGKLDATDLDRDEVLTYGPKNPTADNVTDNGDGTFTIKGAWGELVINAETGAYTYTTYPGVNIPHGSHMERFDVVVKDAVGRGETDLDASIGTDNAQIKINVTGLNTPPEYIGPGLSALYVKEDVYTSEDGQFVLASGKINQSDFFDEDGDTLSFGVSTAENGASNQPYAIGQYGTLFMKPDGTYEYRLNNDMKDVQGLKEGQFLEEKFFIIADDGYGGKTSVPIVVKIEGTNDDPMLSLNDPSGKLFGGGVSLDMVVGGQIGEDQFSIGGKGVATDVDASDTHFVFSFGKDADGNIVTEVDAYATINGKEMVVGKFVIDPDSGAYKFVADKNLEHLKGGEQISIKGTVVVESFDDNGNSGGTASAEVTVNITGTNSAPIMDTVVIGMKEDSGDYVAKGNLADHTYDPDADEGDLNSFAVKAGSGVVQTGPNTWEGKYGTLTLHPDGTYTYTLHNDKVQELAEGEHDYDNFTIIVKDQYGASSQSTLSVDIEGTNDAPVLDNIKLAQVEDGASVGGQFHGTDVDHGAVLTYSVAEGVEDDGREGFDHKVTGEYGTLYYNSQTGAYEYVADNSEHLSKGEKVSESFEVTVTDEHGATDSKDLNVNLTGTNKDPVLDPIVSGETEEGGAYVTGQFHATDVNVNDVLTYSVDGAVNNTDPAHAGFDKVAHGEHGTLYYNSQTGEYQYEAGRELAEGQIGSEDFVVRVSDGQGGSDSTGLHIDVTGTNEAPVLDVIAGVDVSEGAVVSGQFHGTDVDQGAVLTYSVAGAAADDSRSGFDHKVTGEHGNLYYNSATGAYEYVAHNANQLSQDAPKESFAVTVTDEHGAADTKDMDVSLAGHDKANLVFTQGTGTAITEGSGAISFNMAMMSGSGTPMTADQDMTVTFVLTSTAIFDWDAANLAGIQHEPNPGGGWLVTATLPAGESTAEITLPTLDAPGFQGERSVIISDMEVSGDGLGSHITVQGESEFTYTVQDPASFHLESGETFDGSASQHGLEIYGSGENEITGSAHGDVIHAGDQGSTIHGGEGNDIIYAGQGDDTLSGGGGNDIFAWESDKLGGSDTILDFDFNYQRNDSGGLEALDGMFNDKIQINFQDLLGEHNDGSLGALLQGLTDVGGKFSYSTEQGGFTAEFTSSNELQITLTSADDATLQTITVQSSNTFHDSIQDMGSDEAAAILQQILICSSTD